MNPLLRAVSLILVFMAMRSSGAEILWVELTAEFYYKDISTICSNRQLPMPIYFGAEVENLKIARAVIKDGMDKLISKTFELTSEEAAKIEPYRDLGNQLWIKNLTVNGRILNWLFFHSSSSSFPCQPYQPLATIEPSAFSFLFDTASLDNGQGRSNLGLFGGKLQDGGAYQARLGFNQKQYTGSDPLN